MRSGAVMAATGWPDCARSLKGVVLDMCGVLYDSGAGDGEAIPGSIEAVQRLKQSDLQLRFCTNETQASRERFVAKLGRLGFDIRQRTAAPPAGLRRSVTGVRLGGSDEPKLCGDRRRSGEVFLPEPERCFSGPGGLDKPLLFSLGQGKYYKETDGLKLDVGVYMKALEYACDVKAEVIGKPSQTFFQSVLGDMGIQPHEALMIGDDLVNDVGGAQSCGMMGVQVRTGKYRPSDEKHPSVKADGTVDNLSQAVDLILHQRGQ
ncbi:hypothetical protein WMY93_010089 [Mugilogobius chulae]|uniref:Phospholysine phosphohistidine inorganic pyrophosphate phosphatase n=1 Tax=Mugilogobius chulae TaxID=88201 RepID=A0AAW0P7N9_9GOBI